MNSSSLSSSSRNSICPCGGKTTKKQVSSVLLPLVALLTIHTIEPRVFCLFLTITPSSCMREITPFIYLDGAYLDIKEIYGILKEQENSEYFKSLKPERALDV